MSKKEEILHKLSTEDRNYIKEKFKEKDEEIKILKKALYLATEQISELQFGCEEFNMCQLCSNWYADAENCAEIECEDGFVNYFLNKAKEMLKDE